MSVDVGVRVEGARELRAALRRAGQRLDDLKAANARVAAFVASAAALRAPRRSGRLAGNVRGNRAAGRAVVMAGGVAVPYAGPVHWGWGARGIDPQPFVVDAAQATEPTWLGFYQADVDQIVDAIGRGT